MAGLKNVGASIVIAALAILGCADAEEREPLAAPLQPDSSYVFGEPDDVFELDEALQEISGLTMLEDGRLAAVQDEDGILYVLDPATGAIVEEREFAGPGDYEGIELVDGRLFILQSDGELIALSEPSADALQLETISVDLVSGCDAEGVAYPRGSGRLLISCKENAGKGLEGMKAIFSFDLATLTLQEQPAYLIDTKIVAAHIEDHPINEAVQSVLSDHLDISGFKPSGLALHPRSGDLFVVSSVEKVIVRLDTGGALVALWNLPPDRFSQPEGIAFAPNGDLYISNEAGSAPHPSLLRYRDRSAGAVPADSAGAAPPDSVAAALADSSVATHAAAAVADSPLAIHAP